MNSQIETLRALVEARFPTAMKVGFGPPTFVCSSVALLEGKLVEVNCSLQSSGSGLLMIHLAEKASGPLAWIDASDSLDIAFLPGEVRRRLLWLRANSVEQSLKATDLLVRDGNLATVMLDLRFVPEKQLFGLPNSLWHRLRMLAEKTNVAVGIFTPFKTVSCAAVRWSMESSFDLTSLEQSREVLHRSLQTSLQRGHDYEQLSPMLCLEN